MTQLTEDLAALVRQVYAEHGHPDDWGVQVIYVDQMVEHLSALLDAQHITEDAGDGGRLSEIDRNARAYGWSVGRGHPLTERIEDVDPENPFLNPEWRALLSPDPEPGQEES